MRHQTLALSALIGALIAGLPVHAQSSTDELLAARVAWYNAFATCDLDTLDRVEDATYTASDQGLFVDKAFQFEFVRQRMTDGECMDNYEPPGAVAYSLFVNR